MTDGPIKITPDLVTPADVIDDLVSDSESFADLYVVAFDHAGRRTIWATGNLQRLATAAIALNTKAADALKEHAT